MDNNWNIIQRLVRIDVCSKSVNANELAEILNQCLSVDGGVRANSLFAAMRDGGSANQAALDKIAFIIPKMLNVVCFSHTLDNVGNHLVIPTLVEFGSLWIRMFHHSCKAKLLWKVLTGQTPRSYSETRWWSKWEVYYQLMVQFEDVERFVEEAKDPKVCPQLLPQLQAILADPQRLMSLKVELAVTIDVGECFVKATYFLEGDGPLPFRKDDSHNVFTNKKFLESKQIQKALVRDDVIITQFASAFGIVLCSRKPLWCRIGETPEICTKRQSY